MTLLARAAAVSVLAILAAGALSVAAPAAGADCKPRRVTGVALDPSNEEAGKALALKRWREIVVRRHGAAYADWARAQRRRRVCGDLLRKDPKTGRTTSLFSCHASGTPCSE